MLFAKQTSQLAGQVLMHKEGLTEKLTIFGELQLQFDPEGVKFSLHVRQSSCVEQVAQPF